MAYLKVQPTHSSEGNEENHEALELDVFPADISIGYLK
jgi:hypothetical protein